MPTKTHQPKWWNMPHCTPRQTRQDDLLRDFERYLKACIIRFKQRGACNRCALQQTGLPACQAPSPLSSELSLIAQESSSDSSSDSNTSSTSSSSSSSNKSFSSTDTSLAGEMPLAELDLLSSSLPELLPIDDSSNSELSSSESASESGYENSGDDNEDNSPFLQTVYPHCLASHVWNRIQGLYAKQYEVSHIDTVPQGPAYLPHVLNILKSKWPNHFCDILWVSP